jgi:hypothetical protein
MGGGACAEVPDRSLAGLEEVATHVFSGKVKRVYSSVEKESADWEVTYSVAEIQVKRVEKGEYKLPLAYLRFWHKRHIGKGQSPVGAFGHRGIPKAGTTTRVFVVMAEDGGFDVVPPNGFVAAGTTASKK